MASNRLSISICSWLSMQIWLIDNGYNLWHMGTPSVVLANSKQNTTQNVHWIWMMSMIDWTCRPKWLLSTHSYCYLITKLFSWFEVRQRSLRTSCVVWQVMYNIYKKKQSCCNILAQIKANKCSSEISWNWNITYTHYCTHTHTHTESRKN